MNRFERAMKIASEVHPERVDEFGGPHIEHLRRVSLSLPENEVAQCVALLQNVVEDSAISLDDLRSEFGDQVADAVDALTRREKEDRLSYYTRVHANPVAVEVGLADIKDRDGPDRLARLEPDMRKQLETKFRRDRSAIYGRYTVVESDLFEWRIDMTSGTLVHEGWSGDGHSEFGHAVEAEHLPELLNASKMKDLAELMKGLENGLEIKSAWLSISRIPYSSFRCP